MGGARGTKSSSRISRDGCDLLDALRERAVVVPNESAGPITCLGFGGANFCEQLAKLARADSKRCVHRIGTGRMGRGQECGLETGDARLDGFHSSDLGRIDFP